MTLPFLLTAAITVAGALGAVAFRNLVHCALALTVCLAGLAAIYLQLNAEFVGFAQILVYIGAVAILIVFAILLTRGGEAEPGGVWSGSVWVAGTIAGGIFAVLAGTVLSSRAGQGSEVGAGVVAVRDIGEALMTRYFLTFQAMGLLLTAALIGAVILAMRGKEDR